MWAAWQLSVPAMGLTCLDQRHPGSKVARPTGPPSRLTSSSFPELDSKGWTSSGLSKFTLIMPPMGAPFVVCGPRDAADAQTAEGAPLDPQYSFRADWHFTYHGMPKSRIQKAVPGPT